MKLPFLATLFLLPTLLALCLERSSWSHGLCLALYALACYFAASHYLQVSVMWGSLLGTMRQIGRGELRAFHSGMLGGQFLQAHRAMEEVIANLGAIAEEARGASGHIVREAQAFADGNENLSRRTQAQAGTLQQTASSMEAMSAAVQANAHSCQSAQELAQRATQAAADGAGMVQRVVTTMAGIEDRSRKVADIVGMIEDIAFQTSILSLNAAVEAARVGEQGHGFAMVASEVRALATRSADSAREIRVLVTDAQAGVKQGSRLVGETGQIIARVVASVREAAASIGQIADASRQQAVGVGEIERALAQLDEVTRQNAEMVTTARTAVLSLGEEAARMTDTVALFTATQPDPTALHEPQGRLPGPPALMQAALGGEAAS
ncbi:MAG: methyl-accepting chemotaxis protein [Ramlibacter sp.]